jgi:hypothetical protein
METGKNYAEVINRSNKPMYTAEQLAHCRIICTVCGVSVRTIFEMPAACIANHNQEA